MRLRLLPILLPLLAFYGCSLEEEDRFLDPGIPRVETPNEEIAFVRTKWYNDKHIETAFLDSSDRILEVFGFGRTNSKILNQYKGSYLWKTTDYHHSDSAPYGWVTISTTYRKYGSKGRLISKLTAYSDGGKSYGSNPTTHYTKRYLGYTTNGDTIVRKVERNFEMPDLSTYLDIDRWEQDNKKQITRHYRLYVMPMPSGPDTTNHYSQRFAYDSSGQLTMSWYDYMYLGDFYRAEGPDTVWYSYDGRNRLVKELRRFTTDMSNKSEPSSKGLTDSQKDTRKWDRDRFFIGDKIFHNNNKTDTVTYHYEAFDSEGHLPLKIPTDLDF